MSTEIILSCSGLLGEKLRTRMEGGSYYERVAKRLSDDISHDRGSIKVWNSRLQRGGCGYCRISEVHLPYNSYPVIYIYYLLSFLYYHKLKNVMLNTHSYCFYGLHPLSPASCMLIFTPHFNIHIRRHRRKTSVFAFANVKIQVVMNTSIVIRGYCHFFKILFIAFTNIYEIFTNENYVNQRWLVSNDWYLISF